MTCLDNTISLSLTPYTYLTSEEKTEGSCSSRMLKTIAALAALVPATLLYVGALIAQTLLSCCSFSKPVTLEGDQDRAEKSFAEIHEELQPPEKSLEVSNSFIDFSLAAEEFLKIDYRIRKLLPEQTPLPSEEGKAAVAASSFGKLKEKLPALNRYIIEFSQAIHAYLRTNPSNKETLVDCYADWNFELKSIYIYAIEIASLSGDREFVRTANQTIEDLETFFRLFRFQM